MADISSNISEVRKKIAEAARVGEREPESITLVAVSKTFDSEDIARALETGHRVFGENRVQEAQGKWPDLKRRYNGVELHLIGPLQSNKAGDAVGLFDVIQTIDREKIAHAVSKEIKKQDRHPRLFVQVNTGAEDQKAGVDPEKAVEFVDFCRETCGLVIDGMMCIPPIDENPGPHFALLRKLANEANLECLSMGMSSDYETAIELGATHVRVGSAIFGSRDRE